MPEYRLYAIDGAGKIHSAEWLQADSDEQAIEAVQQRDRSSKYELWQGGRLIAAVPRE